MSSTVSTRWSRRSISMAAVLPLSGEDPRTTAPRSVVPRTYVRLMPRVSGSTSVEGVLIDWVVRHPVTPSQLPVEWLSREQKAAELARLQAEKAARAAYEAELIVGLADDTPELPDDHPAAGTGSWAPDG